MSHPVLSGIWTKICGITRAEDAEAVAELGADAVGAVLFPGSSRAVEISQCPEILGHLAGNIRKVALFVNPDQEFVAAALAENVFDLLQFHGEESAGFCEQFNVPYIKAVRVRDYDQAMAEIAVYETAEYVLLDRYQENVPGGTGKTFDWNIANKIVANSDRPVVLAGGLTPENVATAIEQVAPFGVDVSSGVEQAPGIKSIDKVKRFLEASKRG